MELCDLEHSQGEFVQLKIIKNTCEVKRYILLNVPVLFYSVSLYISTYGMPLVQSDHLAGTKYCVTLLEIYFRFLHPSCCKHTNLATHDRSH